MNGCNPHATHCETVSRSQHQEGSFPLVWANHTTAPIIFFLSVVLILYFSHEILTYIRSGRR